MLASDLEACFVSFLLLKIVTCFYEKEVIIINLTGMILKMRYCILEQVGAGGEGHLYLARDMELGNYWAVKELPLEKKREARLLRLLEHPSIPRMVDYVENGDHCYLIMEYIRGKSLGQMLKEGHVFAVDELLSYGDTVLAVLEYLHGQKPPVYYGDLKPDNLMLSDSGKLYLVDFGSAVFGFGENQRICMGTEGFAAPEQYEGKVNSSSDLYALGKTLQALAGKNWLSVLWKAPGFALFLYKDKEADKFLLKKCEHAESALQKLQKEYTKDEEQRKLLLLLAVNAELQKEWERAAVYYEQLLLYAPEFAEGYGKYGLFLLRRGQKNSSRRLYVLYRSSKADGTDCKSVEIWEKQMESETGEGK